MRNMMDALIAGMAETLSLCYRLNQIREAHAEPRTMDPDALIIKDALECYAQQTCREIRSAARRSHPKYFPGVAHPAEDHEALRIAEDDTIGRR